HPDRHTPGPVVQHPVSHCVADLDTASPHSGGQRGNHQQPAHSNHADRYHAADQQRQPLDGAEPAAPPAIPGPADHTPTTHDTAAADKQPHHNTPGRLIDPDPLRP